MICPKCKADEIIIAQDSRGLAEARCAKCGAFIKKMSVKEVIAYYEDKLKEKPVAPQVDEPQAEEPKDKMMCNYCCEHVYIRRGRLGTVYTPVESNYCPVCGRKHKPTDFDY